MNAVSAEFFSSIVFFLLILTILGGFPKKTLAKAASYRKKNYLCLL